MISTSDIWYITDGDNWVPPYNLKYALLNADDQGNPYDNTGWIAEKSSLLASTANRYKSNAEEYRDLVSLSFEKIKEVVNIEPALDESGVYQNSIIHFATSSYHGFSQSGVVAAATLGYVQVTDGVAADRRDIWLLDESSAWSGTPAETTILHEILHALSLEHPSILGIHLIDDRYTVMSYDDGIGGRANRNLGILDIYALQSAYSDRINWDHNSESSFYQFSTATSVGDDDYSQEAIWDTGGIDTLDGSNQNESVVIDLRQGRLSDIDSIRGRNYNIGIAFGSVIENAEGSRFDDVIIGNVASNALMGGDGNDRIFGDGEAYDSNRNWSEWASLSETTDDDEEWVYEGHNGANPSDQQTDVIHGGKGNGLSP